MMHLNMTSLVFDLTETISELTTVYPGDPVFLREQICSVVPHNPSSYHLCRFQMGNHTGTHIDYPAHIQLGGKNSTDYPLKHLIGEGCIIEVPAHLDIITGDFVLAASFKPDDIVFFKTKHTQGTRQISFDLSAAKVLIEKGARIVGTDQMSVDDIHADGLPVHHCLLSSNILIIEGLNLQEVTEGRGEIFIAPLKIADIDGLPARVMMRTSATSLSSTGVGLSCGTGDHC